MNPLSFRETSCDFCGATGRLYDTANRVRCNRSPFVCPFSDEPWHIQGEQLYWAIGRFFNTAHSMRLVSQSRLVSRSVRTALRLESHYLTNHHQDCLNRLRAWLHACRGGVYQPSPNWSVPVREPEKKE